MQKPEGLRELAKKRFIDDVISASLKDSKEAGLILILDQTTANILTNCMTLSELILAGVTAVESIEKTRKAFASFRGVYFLAPSQPNIDHLQADFEPKKLYKSQHVFFARQLSDVDFKYLTQKSFSKRLGGLKEFNFDMSPISDNIFLSNYPDSLELQTDSLLSAIAALQDVSSIEIFKLSDPIFKESAQMFTLLNAKVKSLYPYLNSTGKGVSLRVFLFQRGMDLVSPFVHDLHYEAMLADLLEGQVALPNDESRVKEVNPESKIDPNDRIYRKYRYVFIKDLMTGIPRDLETFIKENATAKAQKKGDAELGVAEMQNVVRGLGEYHEVVKVFNMHVKLSKLTMDRINKESLRELTDSEMSAATGVSDQGEMLNNTKRNAAARKAITTPGVNDDNKLRIALATNGSLSKPDAAIGEALGPAQKRLLDKHSTLVQRFGLFIPDSVSTDYGREVKALYDASDSHLERFISRSEYLVTKVLSGNKLMELESVKFDQGSGTGGLKKGFGNSENTLFRGRLNKAQAENSNNVIFAYFIGGGSYVELCGLARAAKRSKEGARLMAGSTEFLSPKQFIRKLLQ